jgi:predicted GNAT family acetyltransferase
VTDAHDVRIVDVPELGRYELSFDGKRAGLVTYLRAPGLITFIHSEIDPAYEHHGLGHQLARFVLDAARAHGESVRPQCPFIAEYIRDHPEYADLVKR